MKIPEFVSQSDVPATAGAQGIPPSAYGAELFQTMGKLGEAAHGIVQVAEEQKADAQRATLFNDVSTAASTAYTDFSLAQEKNPDSTSHVASREEWTQKYNDKLISQIKDPVVQKATISHLGKMREAAIVKARDEARGMAVDEYMVSGEKKMDAAAVATHKASMDPDHVSDALATFDTEYQARVDGGFMTKEKAYAEKKKRVERFWEDGISMLMQSDPRTAVKYLQAMQLKDSDPNSLHPEDRLSPEKVTHFLSIAKPMMAKQEGYEAYKDEIAVDPGLTDPRQGEDRIREKFKDRPEVADYPISLLKTRAQENHAQEGLAQKKAVGQIEDDIASHIKAKPGVDVSEESLNQVALQELKVRFPGEYFLVQQKLDAANKRAKEERGRKEKDALVDDLVTTMTTTGKYPTSLPKAKVDALRAVNPEAALALVTAMRNGRQADISLALTRLQQSRAEEDYQFRHGTMSQYKTYEQLKNDKTLLSKQDPNALFNRGAIAEWQRDDLIREKQSSKGGKDPYVASAPERTAYTTVFKAAQLKGDSLSAAAMEYKDLRDAWVAQHGTALPSSEWDKMAGFAISTVKVKGYLGTTSTKRMHETTDRKTGEGYSLSPTPVEEKAMAKWFADRGVASPDWQQKNRWLKATRYDAAPSAPATGTTADDGSDE